jgi:hypothetical protein
MTMSAQRTSPASISGKQRSCLNVVFDFSVFSNFCYIFCRCSDPCAGTCGSNAQCQVLLQTLICLSSLLCFLKTENKFNNERGFLHIFCKYNTTSG